MEKVILYDFFKDSSQWLFIPIFIMVILALIITVVKNHKTLLGIPIIFKIAVAIVLIALLFILGRLALVQCGFLISGAKDTRTSIELDKESYNLIVDEARGRPYYISFEDSNGNIVRSFNVFTQEEISIIGQYNEVIVEYGIVDQETICIYIIATFSPKDTEVGSLC